MNPIKVYQLGPFQNHIYEKQDGTFTDWSNNDIIALYVAIVLVGSTLLCVAATIFQSTQP